MILFLLHNNVNNSSIVCYTIVFPPSSPINSYARSRVEQPAGSWQKVLQYRFVRALSDKYIGLGFATEYSCLLDYTRSIECIHRWECHANDFDD